jgi:hypothetical protein
MEPILYYFNVVNRHAVVVKPRQPLLDWINTLYPDLAEDPEYPETIFNNELFW